MSFVVIYYNRNPFSGYGVVKDFMYVNDLNELTTLGITQIIAILEIKRQVPFETKFREVTEIVREKPYLLIDNQVEVHQQGHEHALNHLSLDQP
jgi:hypothetical protein